MPVEPMEPVSAILPRVLLDIERRAQLAKERERRHPRPIRVKHHLKLLK